MDLNEFEIEEVIKLWKKQVIKNKTVIGNMFFSKLFEVYPEIIHKFEDFDNLEGDELKNEFNVFGQKAFDSIKNMVATLDDMSILYQVCRMERKALERFKFTAADYYLMKEAIIMVFENFNGAEITNSSK